MAIYFGDNGDNDYFGTDAADLAYGYGGSDFLRGGAGNDIIYGGDGDDLLFGSGGDDRLYGDAGDDILRNSSGFDQFDGGDGFDRISFLNQGSDGVPTHGIIIDLARQLILDDGFGNREKIVSIEGVGATLPYADILRGSEGANLLWGGQGDKMLGFGGDDEILAEGVANTYIDGGEGRDSLFLTSSRFVFNASGGIVNETATAGIIADLSRGRVVNDGFGASAGIRSIEDLSYDGAFDSRLTGSGGNNNLTTGSGDDRLFGLDGDDILTGGAGKDQLTGGTGADTFVFRGFAYDAFFGATVPADSGARLVDADRIMDFNQSQGDLIDLSQIDAIYAADGSSAFNDALTWRGTLGFTGEAGEARYQVRGGNTYIYLEVDGERGVDMMIRVDGVHELTASDFVF